MKRLSTFLLALLLTCIGANAQTVVHECEAVFADWNITSTTGTFQLNTWSTEADASGMVTPFIEYWVGSGNILPDATISHTALTGLAIGYYEVSIFARAFNENSLTAVSKGITFTANDASVDLTEGTAGEFDSKSEEDYGVYELLVYVEDGTLNIGFTIQGLTACDWMAFKNLEVTYLGESPIGYVAHECEAYGDDWGKPAHWTADNDNTTNLHVNKHSTEADPSGMVTPFVEYWYASGTNLPDDVLRHDQLTGLYPGYYAVSVDVRAFNESGTTAINEGVTTFNAVSGENTVSADITTLTSTTEFSSHYELYGTLNLMAQVTAALEGTTGTLDIDFTVNNANYNWLSFKNLSVTYLGEELTYSIGTPQCSLDGKYVQPGSTVTITFPNCITPDDSKTPTLNTTNKITVNGTNVDATLSYSGTTATVTFTMPSTIEYGTTVTVTVPAGLIYWDSTDVSSAAATFTLSTPAMEDQEGVYLLNCHIDEFISRGFAWGTEADADQYGIPVNIIADEDGLYTIQFVDNSLYLGYTGWAYTDCSGENIMHYSIEEYNNGGVTGYRFKCEEATTESGGDCYLYVNESGDFLIANNGHAGTLGTDPQNYTYETQLVWQILSMEERDDHKAAFVASQNAAIAGLVSADDLDTYIASKVANDVTRLVVNPDFSAVATSGASGWVASNMNDNGNNSTTVTGGENGLEVYDGCEQIQQTITGLNQGVYKIDLKGFFRQATNDVCWPYKDYDMSIAYVKANDYEINLKPWGSEATLSGGTYTPDDKAGAYSACASGYANELYTYVGSDGQLVITIAVPGYEYHEWMYVRGMALTYYGDEVEDDSEYKTGDEVTVGDVLYAVASDNLFVNGGFNNGMIGWTAGGYTTDAFPSDFDVQSTGGFNEKPYLTVASQGVASEKTPSQAVEIESGKQYLFIGYTNGSVPNSDNMLYSSLFKMSLDADGNKTEESSNNQPVPYVTLTWSADAGSTATSWTQTMEVFTAETAYAGVRLGWSNGSYDGFQLYEVEPVASEVEWTMTTANWGTLILPFNAEIPATDDSDESITWTAYSCSGLESDGETLTLTEVTDGLAANTPYILSGDAGTYTFKGTPVALGEGGTLTAGMLTGTFVNMTYDDFTHDGTQYLLQNHTGANEGGVAFYPVVESKSAEATLTPYHCYLTTSSGSGVRGFISFPDSGETTAIVAVEGAEAEADGAIYDLSGRKVSKAVKGVYIQNGKKVLVK